MAERRTRRRFTREYKAQAVPQLIESGRPPADVGILQSAALALSLGLSHSSRGPRQHGGTHHAQGGLIFSRISQIPGSGITRCGAVGPVWAVNQPLDAVRGWSLGLFCPGSYADEPPIWRLSVEKLRPAQTSACPEDLIRSPRQRGPGGRRVSQFRESWRPSS
jgi:hypothetical protein